MSNVVDILLKMDAEKLELPKKMVEIKRLSELAGEPVVFEIKALTQTQFEEIQDMSTKFDPISNKADIDVFTIKLETILKGVVSPELKRKELLEHYKVPTPYDLIKKLFTPGEIDRLYNEISDLSGFGEGAVEEVKKP
uniref:XkdN-like protein n=1 Tax=Geobacillus sp. (strain Y4.1MC1) TaxID=581103 RepID=A0A7U3YCT5_GEOS0